MTAVNQVKGKLNVTLHLDSGAIYSSHHSKEHKISLSELANFEIEQLEVIFSNECNFKCSYCTANLSSAWEVELEKFGNYPAAYGAKSFRAPKEDVSPHIKAFWECWPKLKKDLRILRINGGEPLLAKSTFKLLEFLLENPQPEMELFIHSNIGVDLGIFSDFVRLASELTLRKAVKRIEMQTSIDAFGERAEYIRNGLVHENFWINVEKILAISDGTRLSINCTFNALSVTSIIDLMKKVISVNSKFTNPTRGLPVYLGLSALEHPEHMSIQILPESYLPEMEKILKFIEENQWHKMPNSIGFHPDHIEKAKMLIEKMKMPLNPDAKLTYQKNFYKFFSEHDQRRNTDFVKTFPEMADFWNHCRVLVEEESAANFLAEGVAIRKGAQRDLVSLENSQNFDKIRENLNKVGNGFCLAKWTSVTLHLESGTTHSCHHPPVHEVPVEEIQKNPAAIHNSQYKIEQRKKMIEGGRPSECDYCWNIEDLGTGEVSDRILKSSAEWSRSDYGAVLHDPLSTKYKPRYMEVSFSNACQFKCSYCSADYSSTWEEELKKYGDYKNKTGAKTVKSYAEEENPHVKAFWEWWPELRKGLHTFRITGGEPLLSPSTYQVMESLIAHPEPKLSLAVNTNLGAPVVLMEKFLTLADTVISNKAVKKFDIFTSIDAYGKKAEYIRNGLKHDYFWSNLEKVLSRNTEARINIMCTFNALSVSSYIDLLKRIMDFNLKYKNANRQLPIFLDISYLRYPKHQTVQVLPDEYIGEMEKIVEFISDHHWQKSENHVGFHEDQLLKTKRILEWMRQGLPKEEKEILQKDFYSFFSEHDRRRNTNFLEVFPEMENFWKLCQN